MITRPAAVVVLAATALVGAVAAGAPAVANVAGTHVARVGHDGDAHDDHGDGAHGGSGSRGGDSGDSSGPRGGGDAPDRPIAGPQGTVGQFVVECVYSHSSFDDPIVHPGHAGVSHRHDFFGSAVVTAGSTYEELRGGDTSCQQQLDTAAYWAPALLDASGDPVAPARSVAYYRAGIDVDPGTVVAFPPDFKMIAGNADAAGPQSTSVVAWTCNAGATRAVAPPRCPDGANLRLIVTFPDCWNGVDVDSDDHVTHVRYSTGGRCPATHPVAIPQLQFAIDYPHVADPTGYSLASGPLHTAHSDFWNTWDQDKLEHEVAICINRDIICGISGRGVGG